MSFVFYDCETTGTEPAFDQILQFAAIRTDADFNEVDRFEVRSRLLPHIVPSPGALAVTGMSIEDITNPAQPSHYQMVRAIHAKLSAWSPAIFLGYNSIKFDEDLLRQALYQTLHPPYLTNTGGNCRGDVMKLAQAASALAPCVLEIPAPEGKPLFKLGLLAAANGIELANAHDALSDVEATLQLCRLIRERAPELWSNFLRNLPKTAAHQFVTNESRFVAVEFYYNKPVAYVGTLIGFDPKQPSTALVADLSVDLQELCGASDQELTARAKRAPKPIRRLKLNTAPTLVRVKEAPQCLLARLPSDDIQQQQLALLKTDPLLGQRLANAHLATQKEYDAPLYVEQRIYDGFVGPADTKRMAAFHQAPWAERPAILARIEDPRVRELGRRLVYFESPASLSADDRISIEQDMAARMTAPSDDSLPWLTREAALELTGTMLANSTGRVKTVLEGLAVFLRSRRMPCFPTSAG
jgi:exodeoxyribonuclease-1